MLSETKPTESGWYWYLGRELSELYPAIVRVLFAHQDENGVSKFVVFSGSWLPLPNGNLSGKTYYEIPLDELNGRWSEALKRPTV